MTTYEKLLCAAAEYEVEQLKNSGQVFVLDKSIFTPSGGDRGNCVYHQVFGGWDNDKARDFKKRNNILTGFLPSRTDGSGSGGTALERLMLTLWDSGKKEQVYKIVEQFATWKNDIPAEENLFTL